MPDTNATSTTTTATAAAAAAATTATVLQLQPPAPLRRVSTIQQEKTEDPTLDTSSPSRARTTTLDAVSELSDGGAEDNQTSSYAYELYAKAQQEAAAAASAGLSPPSTRTVRVTSAEKMQLQKLPMHQQNAFSPLHLAQAQAEADAPKPMLTWRTSASQESVLLASGALKKKGGIKLSR